MFFVFEGVDGAGKSTQIKLFAQWLKDQGHDIVACNDPGSTELGEQIRSILLGNHKIPISMRAEMMLFTTARTQLVEQIIKPALNQGQSVVLDRYIFSTVVYQGHAGALNPDELWSINRIATSGTMPDMTFILDLPVATAMDRLGGALDRMESRGAEYFELVRNGFLTEAERWPEGVEVIDATQTPENMQTEIRKLASQAIIRNTKSQA